MPDERFLPGCHPIDMFGNGGFRFGGLSHRGSLLILPSGMWAFQPGNWAAVTTSDLQRMAQETPAIDLLVCGTGETMLRPPATVAAFLRGLSLPCETMSTAAAVRTYNVLVGEGRRVAAILIAVGVPRG